MEKLSKTVLRSDLVFFKSIDTIGNVKFGPPNDNQAIYVVCYLFLTDYKFVSSSYLL